MKFSQLMASFSLATTLIFDTSFAANYNVTSLADTNTPGTLRYVINQINQAQSSQVANVSFAITGSCTLGSNLPPVLYPASFTSALPFYVDGSNQYRGLILYPGPQASNVGMSLSGISFSNCVAIGGSGGYTLLGNTGCGGGGGAGLGGAIFVGPNVNATFTSGNMISCASQGGAGGTCAAVIAHSAGGGGGGMAGFGGGVNNLSASAPVGAGGGGGLIFNGGNGNGSNWAAGGGGAGGAGQDGSSNPTQAGFGGTSTPFGNAGNGGNAVNVIATSGNTFGGGGGDAGISIGGFGGFGAGGGGGGANSAGAPGGSGGFGGGGGGAGAGNVIVPTAGGAGGYGGGGGGGASSLSGAGGFGGASGKATGAGGGGAGLGGALFIHQNAVCNLIFGLPPVQFSSNSVTVTDAQALALGPDIFMMNGATLNLNNQQATPYTMPSAIVSDFPLNNSLIGGITVKAAQPIILSGTNSFTGGIEIINGTLSLGPTATFFNLNPLVVEAGGCFDTSLSTLASIQVGEIISSGTQDGLINIGVTNLGVTLFNSDGSFNGGFTSGALGVLTFNSSLSGSTAAFTYAGSSSNFLGTVTVNPGVSLFLGQGGNFSGTTTFNLAGGTLDVSLLTSNQTLGPVIGSGTLNLGTTPLTVNPFYSCTFAGAITGSNTLNVYGSNVNYWTLSGSSSFSGTVNLPASQVMKLNSAQIPALFNLSTLSTLYVNGSSAINNLAGYGNVILSTGDALSFNTTGTSSFYGAFSGFNNSSIVVNGSGSLALYGDNSGFLGNFIINGGSLILEDLGKLPQVITINKPGTLDISNVGPLVAGNNVDLSNITGSGNVNIGAQNLVFVNSTAPIAPFTGGIIGTGNITFSGINPFLLGGNLNTTGNIIIDPVGVTLSGSASISPCNSIIFMGGTLTAGSISGFNLYNVSGTGSIVGASASLNFLNTQSSLFSGTLTSNGGLTFSGSNTLSLNTQGTISGSCVISSGTVNLLQGGIFGSCSNLSLLTPGVLSTYQTYATLSNLNGSGVLYHGMMPVDIINGTIQNLAGTISGSGTVTFQLGATATLLGQFYSNSPIKSLAPIELEPLGLMTLDNTFDVLNTMSINGTGYVFMNATSSAQTIFNQEGALIVNSLLTCGNLNLLPNAFLGGVGTVSLNGTFYPQGLIAPGFNPLGIFGTLTLNTTQGVEFTSTSGFDVSFGSNGQDSLFVQGNCQIDPGSTLVVNQESTLVMPFKKYTILQTTGGVSGVFSSIQTNIDPSQIQVIYNPSSVEIALQAKLIATGNAGKVASVLNQNMLSTDPEVVNLITNLLIAQSQGRAQNALDQLQLSPFKSASLIGDNLLTNVMLGVIKELELDAITKYVCSCRIPKQTPKKYNAFFDTSLFDDLKETNDEDCTKNFNGHIYLKGIGSSYFQKNHDQYAGYKTLDGGLLLGGRYDFAKYFSLNLAVAYQTGKINLYKNRGHIGLNQVSSMVLANYASKHLEAALGYAYGYTRQQDVRKVSFINISEIARNNHASSSQAGFLKAGLLYNISKTTTISPYDYVSYIYQNEDAFTERNGGVVDLAAQKSTSNFIRNELGIRFNHCRNYDSVRLKAFLKGAYVQEVRFNSANYTQKFLALPQEFTTSGYMPTRALGLFGVGLNAGYGEDQFDFGFLYDVEGCHDYIGQRFEIGFSFHF